MDEPASGLTPRERSFYQETDPRLRGAFYDFVAAHPEAQLPLGGLAPGRGLRYQASGHGDRVLLLLPGLLGSAPSLFRLITAFEDRYRVLAVTYPVSPSLDLQLAGLEAVLGREAQDRRLVVLGQTLGGYLAQAFLRQRLRAGKAEEIESLILCHADLADPAQASAFRAAASNMRWYPYFMIRRRFLGILLPMVERLVTSGQISPQQGAFVQARLRHRFHCRVDKQVVRARHGLLAEIHAAGPPAREELAGWKGRVLALQAEGKVFGSGAGRLGEVYPEVSLKSLGKGHNLGPIVLPEETCSLIGDFLESS